MPRATIIIPAFNCEAYIGETIQSILSQSYTDYEILIVDDGSTDDTASVTQAFADPRIQYIYQENSGKPSIPRNKAIQKAQGQYVFIFDSDDIMLPGKLAKTVELLDLAPTAGLAFTGFSCVDEAGEIINPSFLSTSKTLADLPKTSILNNEGFLIPSAPASKALVVSNYIGTSGVAMRREVFDTVGYFDEEVRNSDDFLMWQAVASQYDLLYIPEVYHQYRIRSGSISLRKIEDRAPGLIAAIEKMKQYHHDDTDSLRLLDQKIGGFHFEAGYSCFSQYKLTEARRSFINSLKKQVDKRTLLYFSLSLLPATVIAFMKHLKYTLKS